MGFRYAKGLREEAARAILQERERQPFASIADSQVVYRSYGEMSLSCWRRSGR